MFASFADAALPSIPGAPFIAVDGASLMGLQTLVTRNLFALTTSTINQFVQGKTHIWSTYDPHRCRPGLSHVDWLLL